jgi:hypothetical protein
MIDILELAVAESPPCGNYVLVTRDHKDENPHGSNLICHDQGYTLTIPQPRQEDDSEWWFRTWQAEKLAARHGIPKVFVQR